LWWAATQRIELGYHQQRGMAKLARVAGRRDFRNESRRKMLERSRLKPDLTLATGGGYFCDMDAARALGVLDTLEWAKSRGSVTALVSQGIGPVSDGRLRERMAEVLPGVDAIFLRERLSGPPILKELGVPDRIVTIAGDDAILHCAKPSDIAGRHRIGVSLRIARYLQLAGDDHGWLLSAIAQAATDLDAPLRPVTNCEWGDEDRRPLRSLAKLVKRIEPDIRRSAAPQDLALAYRGCRVVVTTIYHPALFALAQGIPVVAICRSDYQLTKFAGVADMFGGEGMVIVDPRDADGRRSIRRRILEAWAAADSMGPKLAVHAASMRSRVNSSYEDLARLLDGERRGTSAA
jgi:polysaccharide pyruvyl transferase WcaK-like protein